MKRITFAATPEQFEAANELFFTMFGENEADLKTFTNASYTDGTTNYAVASCPITSQQEEILAEHVTDDFMYRLGMPPQDALEDMNLKLTEVNENL